MIYNHQRYSWYGPLEKLLSQKFKDMRKRCYNKKCRSYKNYGARGIYICEEWLNDRRKFVEWGIKTGFRSGLSIDRIDNDGPYAPWNCRWATNHIQQNNKSTNVVISVCDLKYTISQWAFLIDRKSSLLYHFRALNDNDADLIWYIDVHWKRLLKSNPERCQQKLEVVSRIDI